MVDEPARSRDLEAEINRLDGVERSIFLVGPGGNPVEAQIFYRRGTSVPRIRRGVEALLVSLGKPLSAGEIAVFELEPEPAPLDGAPATAAASVATVEAAQPPRGIPVASLTTTLLVITGLMLLLTAPWVALVRLITEPLRTAPAGQAVQVASPSAAASDEGPVRVAVAIPPEAVTPDVSAPETTTSAQPTAVAGVRLTAPASPAASIPQSRVVATLPASPTTTPPVPQIVPPTPSTGSGGGTAPKPPLATVRPRANTSNDDDDDDGGEKRKRRHNRAHKHESNAVFKEKDKAKDNRHRKPEKARRNDDDDRRGKNDDDCDD